MKEYLNTAGFITALIITMGIVLISTTNYFIAVWRWNLYGSMLAGAVITIALLFKITNGYKEI